MPSALDRIDIAPPRDAGAIRSFGLALLIHAALIAALTWGVNWKRSDSTATFGAELWTNAPQEAAPIVTTPPPEALPLPAPVVRQPVVQAPPEPTPNVDIALEQEKKRRQLKDQQLAQEKKEREKAKAFQAQADKAKLLKAEQLKAEQLAKAEQAKADALKAKQSQQVAVKQRDDNMKRLEKLMADGGGSPQGSSTNRATAGGKGSSKTYDAIANAAIMPNVVFTEAIDGNPVAVVEVRVASDGTITSTKVVKSSGNTNWDNAVLSGLIRTRVMPKDVDGRVPDTIFILSLRPRF